MSDHPSAPTATLTAVACGAPLLAAFVALAWPDLDAAYAGIDFNAALFEDFLGPYWKTAEALAAGESQPPHGYLYPAFGAWLLVPLTALGKGAASWACALVMLGSVAALLASAFVLRPPTRLRAAAALGAAAFLAHPIVHGAYWGQASLPVIALSAAAFAAWSRDRSTLGGVFVGVAAAIKLTPLVFLAAPLVRRDGHAIAAALVTFAACAIALPMILMGPTNFVGFHVEITSRLREMAAWVATPGGGRGSQDVGALFARAFGASAWTAGRALGVLLAVGLLFHGSRVLSGACTHWARAFVVFAAIPCLVIGPTWPHALAWIVVAWWVAWNEEGGARPLVAASFVLGSALALRLVAHPETYARIALPAAAATLAVLAMGTGPRTEQPASIGEAADADGDSGA